MIEIHCRRCGRPFVADRAAILARLWSLCPACRVPLPPGGGAGGASDPRPLPSRPVAPEAA